jgi:hypothetical protein
MSLISFHRFLIGIAILFCGGYAMWEFDAATSGGGGSAFVLGTVFMLLALGLAVYLKNLRRFLGYEGRPPLR